MLIEYTEIPLLLNNFKLVPLNIGVRNEQFLSCSADSISIVVALVFDDAVEEMHHFVLHKIVNHDPLPENCVPN